MSSVEQLREVLAQVTDPELPVLTIAELGVLRDVRIEEGTVVVTLTPTYSGCPAMQEITADVTRALAAVGEHDVQVRTVLAPAWTTDAMSESGRRKLAAYGIVPPGPRAAGPVLVPLGRAGLRLDCPRCGSGDTEELSHFGSTSCQALWRCRACREPFSHFKAH